MKNILGKVTPTIAAVAVSTVLAAGGGAYAATQITSGQIKDHTITQADLSKRAVQVMQHQSLRDRQDKVQQGVGQVKRQVNQVQGQVQDVKGQVDGIAGLKGAVYRVETYKNGGGGSATVACADDDAVSQTYTAISGGYSASTVETQPGNEFHATASFPGRMDWDTNQPKDGRLDGWIVLGSDKSAPAGVPLKVWALCVPNTSITVDQVPPLGN